MKKAISLLLAFVLCLSLCACRKSEAVTNAETLIDSIGEVTLDRESVIVAAENAYNSLTDEEKAKVENTEVLTAARDRYEFLLKEQAVLGTWHQFTYDPSYISLTFAFSENGKCTITFFNQQPQDAEYTFTEHGVSTYGFDLVFDEIDGIAVLSDPNGAVFVREEEYETVYDKVFVKVDLATADINDYAEFVHLDYRLDDFGEHIPGDTYLIVSKVYDQGLIYVSSSQDTIVEYENGSTSHGGFPFGTACNTPEFGRMKGEIVFVRSEYVDEVIFTDHEREVISKKLGLGGSVWGSNINYLDFPY